MPRKEIKTSETKTSETKTERTKFRLTTDEQPAGFNAKDKSLGNQSSTGIPVQVKQPKKATEN